MACFDPHSKADLSRSATPRPPRARERHLAWALALAVLLGLACQTPARTAAQSTAGPTAGPTPKAEGALDLVWPQPPAPPRVRYRFEIRSPLDLGIRPGLFQRLLDWISGRESPRLVRPYAQAMDPEGRLWVTDPGARRVHIFDSTQVSHRYLPRRGDPPLASPIAVTHDTKGIAYVSDSALGIIHRFDRDGHALESWGGEASLERPTGIAFDSRSKMLWVVDTGNHRIVGFDSRGSVAITLGKRGSRLGEFNFPTHLALASDGRLLVSDTLNFRVQILSPKGEPLGVIGELGDGPGSLSKPKGVAVDRDGHIYVVDALFDNIQVFDETGRLLLHFGGPGSAAGAFWLPAGIHIAEGKMIYVADAYNQRVQVFEYLGGQADE